MCRRRHPLPSRAGAPSRGLRPRPRLALRRRCRAPGAAGQIRARSPRRGARRRPSTGSGRPEALEGRGRRVSSWRRRGLECDDPRRASGRLQRLRHAAQHAGGSDGAASKHIDLAAGLLDQLASDARVAANRVGVLETVRSRTCCLRQSTRGPRRASSRRAAA